MENRKDQAIREDRERFFKKADIYAIRNNQGLTEKQITELETARQKWRDITSKKNYPDIDYAPYSFTPKWMENPYYASCFGKEDNDEHRG